MIRMSAKILDAWLGRSALPGATGRRDTTTSRPEGRSYD